MWVSFHLLAIDLYIQIHLQLSVPFSISSETLSPKHFRSNTFSIYTSLCFSVYVNMFIYVSLPLSQLINLKLSINRGLYFVINTQQKFWKSVFNHLTSTHHLAEKCTNFLRLLDRMKPKDRHREMRNRRCALANVNSLLTDRAPTFPN